MQFAREDVLNIFRETRALLEGHFQLTSGLHSPQYFQCAKVLQYPQYLVGFSEAIADNFSKSEIDVVISPAIGGIVVGTEVGRILNVRTIFAERKEGKMELRRGFEIQHNERVLVVEDVITTGSSTNEVIQIINNAGGKLAGTACIVDRSNGKVKFNAKHFSILTMEVVSYEPADCPLCKAGIKLDKPGSRGNY